MTCKKCSPCCDKNVVHIRVATASIVSDSTLNLFTTTTLAAALANEKRIILTLDPTLLPNSSFPVYIQDAAGTVISLTMPNGNRMRGNIFKSYCMSKCGFSGETKLKCWYGTDTAHILVHMPK